MALNSGSLKNIGNRFKGGNLTLLILAVVMLLLIATSIGAFVLNANKSQSSAEYLGYIAEQELISQQIATKALEAAAGNQEAFGQLQQLRSRFDETLSYLEQGNPETGLSALTESAELQGVSSAWSQYRRDVTTIIDGSEQIAQVAGYVEEINEILPQLLSFSDEVANEIVKARGDQQSVYIASRQLLLAQRIQNNLNRILSGDEAAATRR